MSSGGLLLLLLFVMVVVVNLLLSLLAPSSIGCLAAGCLRYLHASGCRLLVEERSDTMLRPARMHSQIKADLIQKLLQFGNSAWGKK